MQLGLTGANKPRRQRRRVEVVHQSNSFILGEKRIWNLSEPGNYAHSQSDAHKSRDKKARRLIIRGTKEVQIVWSKLTRLGRAFSLILKQDEVVFIASQRVLRPLQRIDTVQFRPRRGPDFCPESPTREKSSSRPTGNTRAADGESLSCAVVTKGPPVSPPEELVTTCRHRLDQRLSQPQSVSRIGERFILGETGTFCLPSDQRRGLSARNRVRWDEM